MIDERAGLEEGEKIGLLYSSLPDHVQRIGLFHEIPCC